IAVIRGHGRNSLDSLAAAAVSCRAGRGRKRPSAELITIMAGRENCLPKPVCRDLPCREQRNHHTPKALDRRSRLGEKMMPQRKRGGVIPLSSFRPGFLRVIGRRWQVQAGQLNSAAPPPFAPPP